MQHQKTLSSSRSLQNTLSRLVRTSSAAVLVAGLAACTGGGNTPEPDATPESEPAQTPEAEPGTDPYTPEMLDAYRAALPERELLRSPTIQSEASAVIGDPAAYPSLLGPQVNAVNQTVGDLIDVLENVTNLPPTFFNSESREFVWGPFENRDSALEGDKIVVYIKDHGEDAEDFRFTYAFIRAQGNDVGTFTPVIWGGTSPDLEDGGKGVVLYDFDAHMAFELEHNPDPAQMVGGRFVVAFARHVNGDDSATHVVSVFRNFQPGDAETPISFEQFYGRYSKGETLDAPGYTVDFADANLHANVYPTPGDGSADEDISIRVALIDEGYGRGQAFIDGGDLDTANSTLHGVECWDQFVARAYYRTDVEGDLAGEADMLTLEEEGDFETGCPLILATDLEDLEIPTLDDVDPALLDVLDRVATDGIQE